MVKLCKRVYGLTACSKSLEAALHLTKSRKFRHLLTESITKDALQICKLPILEFKDTRPKTASFNKNPAADLTPARDLHSPYVVCIHCIGSVIIVEKMSLAREFSAV